MIRILLSLIFLFSLLGCESKTVSGLPDFTVLVENAAPAIVNVSGKAAPEQARDAAPPPLFNWFREFIDPQEKQPAPEEKQPSRSLGSGFILSEDGEILTNYHVIAGVKEITVTLADRRQFQAQVLGKDPASDLALLKIEAKDLPRLEFGSSADLKVGEWVLAIGSPFGFEQTVTAGIVSGKRRALGSEQYVPFLQTDVAINPGNSGGPLFNLAGEVVGINSQIFSQTGGYMGLSFAVPSDTASSVIKQLREHGRVRRAWLGVVIQKVDAALAESFGLDHAEGALVSHVEPNAPAEKAGIQSGDVILQIDGDAVGDSSALPPMVGQRAPGEKVHLKVLRDGRRISLMVTLGELPVAGEFSQSDWLGIEAESLSERQMARLDIDQGLVVRDLDAAGAAAKAGLRPGDVLLSWSGEPLATPEALAQRAAGLGPGESTALLVLRERRTLFIALQRPEPD